MIRRVMLRTLAVVVLLLTVLILPLQQASADSEQYLDRVDTYNYKWYMYYHPREVTYSPYGIAFDKQDGPALDLRTWDCNTHTNYGPDTYFPNSDPTGYIFLKANYSSPSYLYFCLESYSLGNYSQDTFSGTLSWDGVDY